MTNSTKCLRCNSVRMEPGVLEANGRLNYRAEKTKVMTFLTSDIGVRANICLDCGFIEMIGNFRKAQSLVAGAKSA